MSSNEPIKLEITYKKEDFQKICRICLSDAEESSLINLFTVQYEDIFIKDILEELFGNKILSDPELPQNVCHPCIVETIRCYNFKKTCNRSDVVFQAIILNNSDKSCLDETETGDSEALDKNKQPTASIKEEKCPQDLLDAMDHIKTLSDITVLKKPIGKTQAVPISKSRKNKTLTKKKPKSKPRKILKTKSKKPNRKQPVIPETQPPDKNENPTIEEIIFREDGMENEDETGKVPEDPKILEAKRCRCFCGVVFSEEWEFRKHKEREKHRSSNRRYLCTLCNKFYDIGAYKNHLFIHTNQKPHICEVCSRGFSFIHNLQRHIRIRHEGEKSHVCKTCGRGFATSHGMKVHYRLHTGEKPYLCDLCGQRFTSQGSFDKHRLNNMVHEIKKKPEKNLIFTNIDMGRCLPHILIHHTEHIYTRNRQLRLHSHE